MKYTTLYKVTPTPEEAPHWLGQLLWLIALALGFTSFLWLGYLLGL